MTAPIELVEQAQAELEAAQAEARDAIAHGAWNERERTRMAVVRAEARLRDAMWRAEHPDLDGAA